MSELIIKPKDFQSEVDSYKGTVAKLSLIKYTVDPQDLELNAIDELTECVELLNELVEAIVEYGNRDVRNLQNLKSAFLKMDEDLGDRTLVEYVKGEK